MISSEFTKSSLDHGSQKVFTTTFLKKFDEFILLIMSEGFVDLKIIPEPDPNQPDYMRLEAWGMLTDRFGSKVNKNELTSLATVCAIQLNLTFMSKDKKNKSTLVHWYEEHKHVLFPYIDGNIQILGENKEVIFS